MNDTQTKQNEMKADKVKQNGTKPTEIKSVKDSPVFYEMPLPEDEALRCLTAYLNDVRRTAVTAVSVRISDGRVMVGVLPDGEK